MFLKKQMRNKYEEAMSATFQIEIKAFIYQECFSDHIRPYINQFLPW